MSIAEAGLVLVTGATGFIGRRVVARLLEEGAEVRALVLPDDPVPAEWTGRVEVRSERAAWLAGRRG